MAYFNEYTKEVTKSELFLVNKVVEILNSRVGKKNAITNREIREKILKSIGISIPAAKIRKYIQYIRVKHLSDMLCASSKGYYKADTVMEWDRYRESFTNRINAINKTYNELFGQ